MTVLFEYFDFSCKHEMLQLLMKIGASINTNMLADETKFILP